VAHPAHGDVQPVGDGLVEHPQPVVGIRQPQAAAARTQLRSSLQHNTFQQWRPADSWTEPGSDDDVDIAGAQSVDHRDEVFDAVLTVGVKGGEDLRAGLPTGVLDAGLDGGTLAQVHRVAHQMCPGPPGDVAGAVVAAVIHAHDVAEDRAQIGDDVADDTGFVEGWDDDPDVARFTGHLSPQRTRRSPHLG
jgi:hypothetical protein